MENEFAAPGSACLAEPLPTATQANPDGMRRRLDAAHAAQTAWAVAPTAARLRIIRRFRHRLAADAQQVIRSLCLPQGREPAEILAAEVLPLAEACRFLECRARSILSPRRMSRAGQPLWLRGVELEVRREPHGVVLILGAANYPLFLPGVQVLQALAAGNAVLLKPGCNAGPAAEMFASLLFSCGLDEALLSVLPEDPAAAQSAIEIGIDKVFLTGSVGSGAAVLSALAPRLTPATMELSGCDAVFVRADSDLDRVVQALCFGLSLNRGATCIAPRRVFVHHSLAGRLEQALTAAMTKIRPIHLDSGAARRVLPLVRDAIRDGARLLAGKLCSDTAISPIVLAGARGSMSLLQSDLFAPVLALVAVADDDDALCQARACPYALGATVFGKLHGAMALARRIDAGCVVVNDMIVPTADPRLPFGGRRMSGFGVTRGAEGLLEMTAVKTIAVRHGRWLKHLDPPGAGDAILLHNYLRAVHGGRWRDRCRALFALLRQIIARRSSP